MSDSFAARLCAQYHTVQGEQQHVMRRLQATCGEMLADRGYARVQHYEESQHVSSGALLFMSGGGRSGGGADVDVYLCMEDRVGVRVGRALVDANKECNHCILVVSTDGPTPCTRKEFEGSIQFILAKELCYNVTRHGLVPRHEAVGEDALPPGCLVDQLPRILDTDPVVRYYDWPVGTIIRIERVYVGSEVIPFFRCVSK